MAKAKTDIRSLARSHTTMALNTLASIAKQPKSPPAARVAAAVALLDRGWGKPHQSVEHTGEDGGAIEIVRRIVHGEAASGEKTDEAWPNGDANVRH